jgi:hypothetical protein
LRFSFRLIFAPLGHRSILVQWHDNARVRSKRAGLSGFAGSGVGVTRAFFVPTR